MAAKNSYLLQIPSKTTDFGGATMLMPSNAPSGTLGIRCSATVNGDTFDVSWTDKLSVQAIWTGIPGSGSFYVSSSVPAAAVVTISGSVLETYTAITGATSGSSFNTGTDTTDAALQLATSINYVSALVSASVSGARVLMVAKTEGSGTNYALSSSDASIVRSGTTLAGGAWPSGSIYAYSTFGYIPDRWDRSHSPRLINGIVQGGGVWDAYGNGVAQLIPISGNRSGSAQFTFGSNTVPMMRFSFVKTASTASLYDGVCQLWVLYKE